jgi:adenylate cyclase, class 2
LQTRETEIKLPVADVKATRRRLEELGFRAVRRRSLEDNSLFDTPDRTLRQVRSILRLRHYGGQWIITFKGTPSADPHYKSRLEFETAVDAPGAVRSIFQALGFHPVFRYQKYRSQYVPARGSSDPRKNPQRKKRSPSLPMSIEVSLDETPIGNYLELEGSRRSIDRVARALGYTRNDYSTASYGALYLEDCRKKNIPPADMVFPSRSRRRS